MSQKIELTKHECYSIAFVVYQEWKKTLGSEEVQIFVVYQEWKKTLGSEEVQIFETWLERKLEQERIKNIKPAGNIASFRLK